MKNILKLKVIILLSVCGMSSKLFGELSHWERNQSQQPIVMKLIGPHGNTTCSVIPVFDPNKTTHQDVDCKFGDFPTNCPKTVEIWDKDQKNLLMTKNFESKVCAKLGLMYDGKDIFFWSKYAKGGDCQWFPITTSSNKASCAA